MADGIDEDIPLAGLISIIYRTRNIDLNNSMKMAGLSSGQFNVLLALLKEQNVTQEHISKLFHMDKGTTARAVRKLEESGCICRRIDPDNRRAMRLFLTQCGENIIPGIIELAGEWEKKVCEDLSEREKEKLYSMLRDISEKSLEIVSGLKEGGGED